MFKAVSIVFKVYLIVIETPYAQLSEQEKDSDREQVRRYLPTVIDALTR